MKNLEKEKNFVSAVVYVHENASQVEKFLSLLLQVLKENFLYSEIICVNDGAKAEVSDAIRRISQSVQGVSISALKMSSYHGTELSMTAGVDLAIGDFVFEFDSTMTDFSPEIIMEVYRLSLKGYDIVSAVPDASLSASSRLFYYLFDKFSSNSMTMRTERFRILSRRAINRISSMNKTVPYRKAVYMNCGFPITSIEYTPIYATGHANTREEKNYREKLAVDALLLFTDIGYRLAIGLTSMMMIIAILVGCYGVITYCASSPVPGWTTIICFISFSFFALFGILTIAVKYLQLILNLVFRRKQVRFEGIEKLTK